MITKAEYIWIDGHMPTAKLRSKTKIIECEVKDLSDIPKWGFDGSSTMQAEGHFSDCLLKPVDIYPDPQRINGFLVLHFTEVGFSPEIWEHLPETSEV